MGRGWSVGTSSNVAARFLRRDLVATLRTPGRFGTSALCLVAAGVLLTLSLTMEASIGWPFAAAGAATGYLAMGVFSDGFRHAATAAAAPPLYGWGVARLYLLHSLLPVVMAVATPVVGVLGAVALGFPITVTDGVGAAPVLLFLVLVRAYDSAKGPMPVALITPVPTPVGDMSGVSVLAWQADALLSATIVGMVATTLAGAGQTTSAVLILLSAGVALGLLFRRRLGRL